MLRSTLLKLYGTDFSRDSKQRTNAFSLECFKQASYRDSSLAPTGFIAMHLCNCMHRHLLVLSATVWVHIAQGLRSSITVKSSTAACFPLIWLGCLRIHCSEDVILWYCLGVHMFNNIDIMSHQDSLWQSAKNNLRWDGIVSRLHSTSQYDK